MYCSALVAMATETKSKMASFYDQRKRKSPHNSCPCLYRLLRLPSLPSHSTPLWDNMDTATKTSCLITPSFLHHLLPALHWRIPSYMLLPREDGATWYFMPWIAEMSLHTLKVFFEQCWNYSLYKVMLGHNWSIFLLVWHTSTYNILLYFFNYSFKHKIVNLVDILMYRCTLLVSNCLPLFPSSLAHFSLVLFHPGKQIVLLLPKSCRVKTGQYFSLIMGLLAPSCDRVVNCSMNTSD